MSKIIHTIQYTNCLQSQRCFHLSGVTRGYGIPIQHDVRFGLNLQNKQSNVPITVEQGTKKKRFTSTVSDVDKSDCEVTMPRY